jgi:acylphosphatase
MTTTRVIYSGRVQGVGFRFRTRHIAERYAVTGYVKNLPDGTVELLVQGEEGEIDRFRRGLRTEMRGFIRDEEEAPVGPDVPDLERFDIAY